MFMAVVTGKEQKMEKGKRTNKLTEMWERYDKASIFSIIILLVIGTFFIFSVSHYYVIFIFSQSDNPFYFVIRHLLFCVIGLLVYFAVSRIPTSFYKKTWFPLALIIVELMVIPLFFPAVNGAQRWITLPGLTIQPAELAKLMIILIWSVALSTKMDDYLQRAKILHEKKVGFKRQAKRFWKSWKWPIILTGILLAEYRLQSDNGSLVISIGLIAALIFASGSLPKKSIRVFWGLLLIGVLILGGVYLSLAFKTTEELRLLSESGNYVMGRFISWVNPFAVYSGDGYQLSNSLIAISEGGLFGKGFNNGVQKQGFLTEGFNDFIVANILEEAGVIGMVVVYIFYIVIITRGYKIAKEAANSFDTLITTGITTLFFFQAFWNSGGVVGLLPLKGLTAPLLSFGGTSLIIMLAGLGIIQRVHLQNKARAARLAKEQSNNENN